MRLQAIAMSALLVVSAATSSLHAADNPVSKSIRVVPNPNKRQVLDVQLWTRAKTVNVGDSLTAFVKPSRGARIYVFFTDSAGQTRRIFPNAYDQENRVRGGRTQEIPRNKAYQFIVGPPAGRGTITAYALRDERGPADNPQDDYLYDAYPTSISPRAAMARLLRGQARYQDYAVETAHVTVRSYGSRPTQAQYGNLTITTAPVGAYVYIDGQYMGTTNYRTTSLRRGKHRLYIQLPGYNPIQRDVNISPGENTRLSL